MAEKQTLESMTGGGVTLESLYAGIAEERKKPVSAPASERNLAGTAAVLESSDEDLVGNYVAASQELSESLESPTLERALRRHGDVMDIALGTAAYDLMGESDFEAKTKARILEGADRLSEAFVKDEKAVLSTAALSAEDEDADPYQEEARIDAADARTSEDYAEAVKYEVISARARSFTGEYPMLEAALDTVTAFGMPFAEQKKVSDVTKHMLGERRFFLGSAKRELGENLRAMTNEQRLQFITELVDFMESADGDVLWMKNDLMKMEFLRDEVLHGAVTDVEVVIDNIISVVDFIPIVGMGMRAAGRFIKGSAPPGSVLSTVTRANNSKGRKLLAKIYEDETDEVARAATGKSRADVVVDQEIPEFDVNAPTPNDKVYDPTNVDSFTDAEKQGKAAEIRQALQPTDNWSSSSLGVDIENGKYKIGGVFSNGSTGWRTGQDAIDNAKFHMRKYGVTDEDITLLKNTPDGYVPVKLEDATEFGEYKVKVAVEHEMSALDAGDASILTVDYGWIPGMKQGLEGARKFTNTEIPRYFLSPGDMFDETVMRGAFTSVEQSAQLEKNLLHKAAEWGQTFNKLDKEGQAATWQYLMKANKEGLAESDWELVGRGLGESERAAVKEWREFWDEAWRLENQDARRTLEARGYQVLETGKGEDATKLFIRPVQGPAGVTGKVYDPVTDTVKTMTRDELQLLYQEGGYVGKMSSAEKMGEDVVEHVLVDNTIRNYARGFRESDTVMEYRKGYYKVNYKGGVYVRKNIGVDEAGNPIEKAVAVAQDTKSAQAFIEREAKAAGMDPADWGRVSRGKETDEFDAEMSRAAASGRSAQRVRGKRLENLTPVDEVGDAHIDGPVDSMIKASRSIARRAPTRQWLEGMKSRWLQKYSHLLTKREFGEVVYPSKIEDIGRVGEQAEDFAEAKELWAYIRYMENGYVASMDRRVKGAYLTVADIAAKAGLSGVEGAARRAADTAGITGATKGVAFQAYLATNPIRQFVVQSHQATQLLALNPKYVSGGLHRDVTAMYLGIALKDTGKSKMFNQLAKKMGYKPDELNDMIEGFRNSGLTASIDHSNLVESSLHQLADNAMIRGGTGRAVASAASLPRKLGFDAGEAVNLMTAYLTFRKMGIDAGDLADVANSRKWAAQARNFTYQMNRAGDMPYNQNNLSVIMQFMQVPHKALTTMLFNRQLTPQQKASLVGVNAMLYGVPTATLSALVANLPGINEAPEAQDLVVHGLEQFMLNGMVEAIMGEESDLSVSSLKPLEFGGWMQLIEAGATGGPIEILKRTPAGALIAGRGYDAFREVFRGMYAEDEGLPPLTAMQRMESFLSISSGFSNAFQAAYMQEYGVQYSRNGHLVDESVSAPEVLGKVLGLSSKEFEAAMKFGQEAYKRKQEIEADVKEWYRLYKRTLVMKGEADDIKARLDMIGDAWRVWDKPQYGNIARAELSRLIAQDRQSRQTGHIKKLMRMSGIMSRSELDNYFRDILPEETREAVQDLMNARNEDG